MEKLSGYENIGLGGPLRDLGRKQQRTDRSLCPASLSGDKGYGSQAVSLIGKYAHDVLNIRTLLAKVASVNHASIRMFEKAGYNRCGLLSDWLRIAGRTYDLLLYQIILTGE